MRTLVIGAGALGGYYGACLTRAGRDVTFLVRPRRAEQLAHDGLHVISEQGDFAVTATTITAGNIRASFDLILVAVKAYSLNEAMDQFAPAVGPATAILPILNGMTHLDNLTARFGPDRVLGGLAQISATLDSVGQVVHFGGSELVFGERLAARLVVPGPVAVAGFHGRDDMHQAGVIAAIPEYRQQRKRANPLPMTKDRRCAES